MLDSSGLIHPLFFGLSKRRSKMGVWFITGAGRGMGLHIAMAALAAGQLAVATGAKLS